MIPRRLQSAKLLFALAALASFPMVMSAQAKPSQTGGSAGSSGPVWDIFAGYSYLSPHGTVETLLGGSPTPLPFSYVPIYGGEIFSVSRFFNKHWGIEFIGDIHLQDESVNKATYVYKPLNQFSGPSVGVIYRFRDSATTPFVHLLGGADIIDGPHWQLDHWGPIGTIGGGMDCETPLFKNHLAIRLFQVDYQRAHENWGTGIQEGVGNMNVLRLSAGAVFHTASRETLAPLALSCSVDKTAVYVADQVVITSSVTNVSPHKNVIYSWSGAGASGNGSSATINTSSLAPGAYSVKALIVEDRPTRECLRVIPPQQADCTANFSVKPYDPPTVSCLVNPVTLKPGDTATVTATAVSPQNRPLTYTYSAASGSVSGSGATAAYSSTGAPVGQVPIDVTVADDKGQTARATCTVTVEAPSMAQAPETQVLCAVDFEKDKKRPERVDNEAKACLDEVALGLVNQPDAKLVVVGNATTQEKAAAAKGGEHANAKDLAVMRAVNTKDYLVSEKGIDPSRILVVTGGADTQKSQNYLVPSGANFTADVPGTSPVDETKVHPESRKPLPVRTHHKKAASKSK